MKPTPTAPRDRRNRYEHHFHLTPEALRLLLVLVPLSLAVLGSVVLGMIE
ncbi:MAG TPA: hypothetical protein VGE47_03910 [Burkholderiaceae bacterium]